MWLLSPLSWLLLTLAALALGWRTRADRRRLLRICACCAAVSVFAMTPLCANLLIGWLESPSAQPAFCRSEPPQIAVVLGGGVGQTPRDGEDFSVLSAASKRRVEAAAQWWAQQPGRQLLLAGGPPQPGAMPESRLMAAYARRLGVAPAAMAEEPESRNTRQNAQNVAALAPSPPERVVLITSALHMPRARYAMGNAGFQVCALATDSRLAPARLPGYLLPQTGAMAKTEAALHELAGLLYYRVWERAGSGD
ncbi:YdcF family protein [Pseudoxanthomonas wuyuanensis]|uniref:Uncharacterized SAM-binding protein YcdF, DUF218 family n=1 Tax=Pseudoxanthomonas wuyuanensis TaxID=1073196 RepID=A0A286D9E1_9GAMM|nr:YdcF family protein [Pseudoxanthomonas wuyuanensis]KAF1722001.1 YdcF family protein [Pseudoxanthomonas wuyuanensis]SOD55264.1 Uncharacterized SAM-binding protein YcdF, DUF218 family [Pseudoxanthomonas wuyuanensis]